MYIAKIKDSSGVMHSMMVGDPIGDGGHVIRQITEREVVLRAVAPDQNGRVTGEVLRMPFERSER